MTWPQGPVPFAIEPAIEAARQLEAGRAPVPEQLRMLHTTLSTYLLGLPAELQDATAERLIAALYAPRSFTASVPRRSPVLRHPRETETRT